MNVYYVSKRCWDCYTERSYFDKIWCAAPLQCIVGTFEPSSSASSAAGTITKSNFTSDLPTSSTMSYSTNITPKTNIKIVFGCMTFGAPGAEQARVHERSDCRSILDIFASQGHTELDTARM
ncbi:uncharacterized protein UBRO2_01981 [Ustilago bromivora]|uniref:Uncharacterized protein n=1 Tax=Ustilago bromivora TaxID=307758 RepID=A0A8H8TQL3_9BASI|nr:uncharacterized protein UBRO2_01981 [Ustilago bromivora]